MGPARRGTAEGSHRATPRISQCQEGSWNVKSISIIHRTRTETAAVHVLTARICVL